MTGYVRQSAADIVPTGVVRAAPINNELNALRDAFATAGGHKHDGTAAEGHPVPVIGDSDLLNKIATDTGNNRHGVFVEVGGVAVEQVRFQDGAIVPVTDNDVDLGTSSLEFKDLHIDGTANIDSLVADTADINGGTVDGAVIGGSSAAAGSFTTIGATGAITSTVSTGTAPLVIASTTKVSNLNVDQLDGADWAAPAAIGTSTPAAGTFTSLTANTSLVAATADINGGTLDGAVIGASSAQAITGTTVTATTGFVGGLTGNVTGNTTGTHTGAVIGNVTGDVTGNVTASSGSSSFNDVVINGGLNMNAGTSATITNLTSPTNTNDAATKGYVDTSIANLIDSAPGALDTLNELAAALGDDASFSTTVTNSIATKLALAGGTMSGAIAMGTNKITGLGNPTANQDAATKTYVDTADALKLSLTGGTMSGAIAMGTSKITGLGTPTDNADATTKLYVDGILGSATSAAASAAAAAVSASNAATSESNASTSASNAATSASSASTSATNAAASYDAFDDRYLGSKTSAPSVDNDGNALLTGALYWNSTSSELYLWTGSAWTRSALSGTDYVAKSGDTMTGALTTTALTLSGGTANGVAYLNGSKVLTSGSALTFNGTSLGVGSSSYGDAGTITASIGVAGTTAGGLQLWASSAQEHFIQWGDSTTGSATYAGAISYSHASDFMRFWTNSTEQMRLTSTGLGIGTSSPSEKLTVAGKVLLSVSAPQVVLNRGGTTFQSDIKFQTSGTNNWSIGQALGAVGSNLEFYDYGAGVTRMQLDSSGNLGLGVTPSAWSTGKGIEVGFAGSGIYSYSQTDTEFLSNAYYNAGYKFGGTGRAMMYAMGTAGSGIHSWHISSTSGTAGNAISFTQAMTLDASGNLGVGTTSPTTFSGFKTIELANSSGNAISLVTGTSVIAQTIASNTNGLVYMGSRSNHALLLTTNDTERARIDTSGNLLVGATSSAGRLTVQDSGNSYIVLQSSTAGYANIRCIVTSAAGIIGTEGAFPFVFRTSDAERARISSAGGFSVGTTADPGAGAIYATGNITAYYSSDRKFKENVQDIPNALDIVTSIGSKTFDWTDEYLASHGGEDKYFQPKQSFGVIAQDVQEVFPQAVRTRQDGSLAVDYEKLAILSFGAIGQLLKRIEALEAK